jgi:Na+-transporting methylmalonyl-CoA/oxaloacetate decarboxylase gamma subunit
VVTLNEHKDLVDAEVNIKQLEPLWIVLMILGGLVLLILILLEVVMMCKSKTATVDPVTDPDQTEEGEK